MSYSLFLCSDFALADEAQEFLDVAGQQIILAVDKVEAALGEILRQLEG